MKFLDKSVAALVSAAALSMSLSLFATTPDCGQAAFAKGHHESKHENISEELMHGKTYTCLLYTSFDFLLKRKPLKKIQIRFQRTKSMKIDFY